MIDLTTRHFYAILVVKAEGEALMPSKVLDAVSVGTRLGTRLTVGKVAGLLSRSNGPEIKPT